MTQIPNRSSDEPNIASLLSASYHSLIRRIIADLSSAGFVGLSGNQLHLISRIQEEAVSVAALSDRVGIPMQVAANLVHTATDNGYLQVDDGAVSLTSRGGQAMRIVEEAQRKIELDWEAAIGESAYADLRSRLVELFEATAGDQTSRD